MRLDKWLKVSRLIKRRTVANEACDNGRVTANGRGVKASYEVKPGDVLELKFGERTVKVEESCARETVAAPLPCAHSIPDFGAKVITFL